MLEIICYYLHEIRQAGGFWVNKLKIGIFTDSYKPYTSGVVRSIDTFTTELSNRGHKIYIFAPNYPSCSKEKGIFRFPSIPAPTHPNFSLALPFSLRIRNTIQKLNLDIIHVHSPFLLGRLGTYYAKRMNIPLVFTFHTLYEKYIHYVPFAQALTKDLTRRISSDFCNQCDLVVTPTKVIADYIKSIGVTSPVINIPTGIRVEEYSGGNTNWLRQQYKISKDKKILLYVGRLGKEKNIEWLLEATALIEKQFPNLHLVLVGSGPEKENLKNKVNLLEINDKVTFTGILPKEKVVHCYCSADVFIFASLTETQGLVIGEAKAAGLPVVAVNAFGVSEMVEHGEDGFLTKLSHDNFNYYVLLLLRNNGLTKEMSLRAIENVEKISAKNCASKLLYYYHGLIKPSHNISGY